MKELAFKQGMDKAAQEIGYPDWDAFAKEAAPLLMGAGQVGRMFAGRGAMLGAGVGAAAGALSGPQGQTLGQRAQRGLMGGAMGAAGGAALGGAAGALGQRAYRGHVAQFAQANKALGGRGAAIENVTNRYANAPHFMSRPMQMARQALGNVPGQARQMFGQARQAVGNAAAGARGAMWGAVPSAGR